MGPQGPIKNKTQLKRVNYFSLKKTDVLCQENTKMNSLTPNSNILLFLMFLS